MLTRNFPASLSMIQPYQTSLNLIATDGARSNYSDSAIYGLWTNVNPAPYLKVGAGDTAPAFTDLNLASPIDNLTQSTASEIRASSSADDVVWGQNATFVNNTNESITVKEVGLFRARYYSGITKYFLCARKVLETPVTIAPGEAYTFDYRIKVKTT